MTGLPHALVAVSMLGVEGVLVLGLGLPSHTPTPPRSRHGQTASLPPVAPAARAPMPAARPRVAAALAGHGGVRSGAIAGAPGMSHAASILGRSGGRGVRARLAAAARGVRELSARARTAWRHRSIPRVPGAPPAVARPGPSAAALAMRAALAAADEPNGEEEAVEDEALELAPRGQRLAIVMYHHSNYGITTRLFLAQMEWLHAEGYSTLGMEDLLAFARQGRAVPARSIVLTFDDVGNNAHYRDMRDVILPTLRRLGFRAVLGVITSGVHERGEGRHYTWSEMRRWAGERLVEYASHSATHANLTRLDGVSLWRELRGSRALMESRLGVAVRAIIWPGGHTNARTEAVARAAGYEACMRVWDGRVGPRSDPLRMRRIHPYGGLEAFKARVEGRPRPPVKRASLGWAPAPLAR